jgi:serine/threonine protein kinase
VIGRTVLQYRLIEKLGAGGMGEVYKAQHTGLNRYVAIKVLPPTMSADPENRRRFIREAQAASALNHPNIITIYDIVSEGDTQFIVMEYVEGRTLLELIPAAGLRVPQAILYATQIADALCAAHSAAIIHRDLKPANIMVTASGLVKLLDFGLAKQALSDSVDGSAQTVTHLSAPMTIEGTMMGTVNYMSPEQAEGRKVDTRSDIFSFGAVLYEMLTGQPAFKGSSPLSTLSAVLRDDVTPVVNFSPDVPFELEQIVVQCLRKDPNQRLQSMGEVQQSLAAIRRQLDSGVLYSRQTTPPTRRLSLAKTSPAKTSKTKPGAIAAVAVLLIAALGGGFYYYRSSGRPAAQTQPPPIAAAIPAPPSDGVLTNESILQMTEAKVPPSVIVSQIGASKTNFNLSTSEVMRLSRSGVTATVIEAMRSPVNTGAVPPEGTQVSHRPAVNAVLGDGLPLRLLLLEDIPGDAMQGSPVRFRVADDVRVEDTVVISKGAVATGVIVDAAKKRILGLGGKMTFRLKTVDAVDGQKVNIRSTQALRRDGTSKHAFDNGADKSRQIASSAGSNYTGYVDGAQTISGGN